MKEHKLEYYSVLPILPVERAGTADEIMREIAVFKLLMKFRVHRVQKIMRTAIDDQRKTTGSQQMHHVHHRIFVPGRWVFGIAAQSFAKVPVIGERTDIVSSAHASCRPEDILVLESQVKRPVSPHAESGYGPSFRSG